MKIPAARVDRFVRDPDPRVGLVLVYGPDAGLVRERAERLTRAIVDDPGDPFRLVRLTAADIAEITEAPLGTIKTRIRRGRQLVEDQLGELADSAELLQSTVSNLEDWARDLRVQLQQSPPSSSSQQ